jgi:hypothetical protein
MTKVKYSKELLEEASKDAFSIAQVCRNVGLKPVGGNYRTIIRKLEEFGIDTSHFTGRLWSKDKKLTNITCRLSLQDILKENTNYSSDNLKKRLINEGLKEAKCEICGYTENLELHHINGDHYDNRLENLQILCPNCHAKTDNYRGRGSNKNSTPESLSKRLAKSHYCICKNCNNEFYSDRTDRVRKFCSRECYNEYLHKLQTGVASQAIQENINPEIISELTKENLEKAINNFNDLTNLGKYFNVSRTTIRNYLKKYDLFETFKLKYDFHSKPVLQLNLQGEIIKEWPSITDAANCIGIDRGSISRVCKGKGRSAKGYIWRYIDDI